MNFISTLLRPWIMSYEKRNLYTSWVLSILDAKKDSETCFRGTFCDLGHRKRNATQRTEKAKKETRRQRVVQAVGPFQLFDFVFLSGVVSFPVTVSYSVVWMFVEAWSQELTDFADAQQGDAQQKVR